MNKRIGTFPDSPGVYLMKNDRGRILYVGKAKNLSHRIKSYLQRIESLDPKTKALVKHVETIDYIATSNEVEALVLECSLIKENRPRYNIKLKDDKRYPFIKLTTNERFPRLLLVRQVENDGAEYFGPYTDAGAVRRTLRSIHRLFPLRDCIGKSFKEGRNRECLNFHLRRCLAPCTGRIDQSQYREIVNDVRLFLRGRSSELQDVLEHRMRTLASERRYEAAAVVRDQIASFGKVTERQLAVSPEGADEDVVGLAREGTAACAVVMKIREGRILGSENFRLPVSRDDSDAAVFEAFFELYYHTATDIPGTIYIQFPLGDGGLFLRWLKQKTGHRVAIVMPQRGDKRRLIELAAKNAALKVAAEKRISSRSPAVLTELKGVLGLRGTPARIEAYDVSNLQGSEPVGSMVTFEYGHPLKSGYRRFKIRHVQGTDDYAMLGEVLRRRVMYLKTGKEKTPDLILIDGGKGQLSVARKVLRESDMAHVEVIGLAKRNEEIFTEYSGEGIRLPARSNALRLLQRIRNEAHRFAVAYHRKLRSKRYAHSELDDIEGIGQWRKLLLLVEFGSLKGLKAASLEDIAAVRGIGVTIATRIYERLHTDE